MMEYKAINTDREYRDDPCATCQPLGAVYAAISFYHSLPLVHGSQGCVAYLRSQIIRSYREQVLTVTSALTEDAAVYGGRTRLLEAVVNGDTLYKPEMMPVFTTCLCETIGDDVEGIIKGDENCRDKDVIPISTASYKGDYLCGYDNALSGILSFYYQKEKDIAVLSEKAISVIPGFMGPGDMKAIKKIVRRFGSCIFLGDITEVLCSPNYIDDSHFTEGGTTKEDLKRAFISDFIIICQKYSLPNVTGFYEDTVNPRCLKKLHLPIGVCLTDVFIWELARGTNTPVPDELQRERQELIEVLSTCKKYLYDTNAVILESADIAFGLASMCMEAGIHPVIVASNAKTDDFQADMANLLCSYHNKYNSLVLENIDHLTIEEKINDLLDRGISIDFLFGNTKGKYIEHKFDIPLIRVGFPITDRVGAQRQSIMGYKSMRMMLENLTNIYISRNDKYVDGVI